MDNRTSVATSGSLKPKPNRHCAKERISRRDWFFTRYDSTFSDQFRYPSHNIKSPLPASGLPQEGAFRSESFLLMNHVDGSVGKRCHVEIAVGPAHDIGHDSEILTGNEAC